MSQVRFTRYDGSPATFRRHSEADDSLRVASLGIGADSPGSGRVTLTQSAQSGLTASTEVVGADVNASATKTWATGNLSTQREVLVQAPTYTAVGTSTITSAATLAVTGAPTANAPLSITNPWALWVQSGASRFEGTVVADTYAIRNANDDGNLNAISASANVLTIGDITSVAGLNIKAGGVITVNVTGIQIWYWTNTILYMCRPTLVFDKDQNAPLIGQATETVANSVCEDLTLGAQGISAATGTGYGGAVGIRGGIATGSGTNVHGNIWCHVKPSSFEGGQKILYLANAVTAPSANPTDGAFIYPLSGVLTLHGSGGAKLAVGAGVTITQPIATSGTPDAGLLLTAAAHTGLANAEAIDVDLDLDRTVQFTGATTLSTQRAVVIRAPIYSSDTATKTISEATTLSITGAPVAGTNVTITNPYALSIEGGRVSHENTVIGSAVSLKTTHTTSVTMSSGADSGGVDAFYAGCTTAGTASASGTGIASLCGSVGIFTHTSEGSIASGAGVVGVGWGAGEGLSLGTVTDVAGVVGFSGYHPGNLPDAAAEENAAAILADSPVGTSALRTINTMRGVRVKNQGATGITDAIGVDIATQSGASGKNLGLRSASSIEVGDITLISTGLLKWASAIDPTGITEVGHDTTTGRPRIYVDGAVHDVAHVGECGALLLETITVSGSPVQSVAFSGLDGNTDQIYYLVWRIKIGVNASNVDVRPNNLTTDMTQLRHYVTSAGSHSYDNSNTVPRIAAAYAGSVVTGEMTIQAKTGFERQFSGVDTESMSGGEDLIMSQRTTRWTDDSTNITSLVVHASDSVGLAVGTYVSLYKVIK